MRKLIILGLLLMGSVSLNAMASDEATPTNDEGSGPQCQAVEVDGQSTMACFNLSQDQARAIDSSVDYRRCYRVCNVRVIGPCLIWHTVCQNWR